MRVLVTRAEQQAAGLAEALRARGAEPVIIPTIEVAPPSNYTSLDDGIANIASFTWIVFTSSNGVSAFLKRGGEVPPWVLVAAIGAATAKPLEQAGIQVALLPERAVAESLAEELIARVSPGDRVLLIRAEKGRNVLPERLASAGVEVTLAAAYRNIVPEDSIDAVRNLFTGQGVDAVTFTSSSSVTHLLALLDAAGLKLPDDVFRISIGPITSATMRSAGIPPHAEACEASVDSLAQAVFQATRSN